MEYFNAIYHAVIFEERGEEEGGAVQVRVRLECPETPLKWALEIRAAAYAVDQVADGLTDLLRQKVEVGIAPAIKTVLSHGGGVPVGLDLDSAMKAAERLEGARCVQVVQVMAQVEKQRLPFAAATAAYPSTVEAAKAWWRERGGVVRGGEGGSTVGKGMGSGVLLRFEHPAAAVLGGLEGPTLRRYDAGGGGETLEVSAPRRGGDDYPFRPYPWLPTRGDNPLVEGACFVEVGDGGAGEGVEVGGERAAVTLLIGALVTYLDLLHLAMRQAGSPVRGWTDDPMVGLHQRTLH